MDASFQSRRTVWVKHSAERKLDLGFVMLGFQFGVHFEEEENEKQLQV